MRVLILLKQGTGTYHPQLLHTSIGLLHNSHFSTVQNMCLSPRMANRLINCYRGITFAISLIKNYF